MLPKFIHLNLHTEHSIIDGTIKIKELIKRCVEEQVPSVAVTDFCNFFGLVKFYKEAIKNGVKPIVGADLLCVTSNDSTIEYKVTILCKNNVGYKNAKVLISRAYLNGQNLGVPRVNIDWFKECCDGLIIMAHGKRNVFHMDFLKELFQKDFYISIDSPNDKQSLEFAENNSIPIVAVNSIRFLKKEDFDAHEARVCIHDGTILDDPGRKIRYREDQYFKSIAEMQREFCMIPNALANSVEIAKKCNVFIEFDEVYLPNYKVPDGVTIEEFLSIESKNGLEGRKFNKNRKDEYLKRLEYELTVINKMGFPGYFLIVADFIKWAKENNIPVGPGRGSGAGSIVAYALKITDIDPIEHELLFERFLNPERVSMPDFDIDFCMDGRDKVIEYVSNKYGKHAVSQIITFGTMAAKAVVRDVGRVLGHPYGFVDRIAKLIPFELGITLDKALGSEEQLNNLYNNDEEVKLLIDLAKRLEGVTRNVGKHAGGVVIAPSELTDFTPLYCEAGGANLVTQFDKNDIESIGLVKFDFLGLRTLTIINWTIESIQSRFNRKIDLIDLPLDDKKTFDMLLDCKTKAIFQIESKGMSDLARRLQPDRFEDIVALVALFRPGPLQSGMVDDFIERKHGRTQVRYLHPQLETILEPTYGVILYQEQVMQIAQILAKYSLGAADLLRRAMGKKKPEEMAKQRAIFISGAYENGVDKELANSIFDIMEKFAGYGFNRSHSVGYAMISYQTAWLKAHYPEDFMASVLSSDMDNSDKVVLYFKECLSMGIDVIFPNINISSYKFTVTKDNKITYGLGAIKGVGEAAIGAIIEERNSQGSFLNLFELCKRTDSRKINKKTLEALVKSGSLDSFGKTRATLLKSIPFALKFAERSSKDSISGQMDLFGGVEHKENYDSLYKSVDEFSKDKILQYEHDTLGLYLSGHPVAKYINEFRFAGLKSLSAITGNVKAVKVAGLITYLKIVSTKSGQKMAVVSIDDGDSKIDITLFPEVYRLYRDLLIKNNIIIVSGDVVFDSFSDTYKIQSKDLYSIEKFRLKFGRFVNIDIDHSSDVKIFMSFLSQMECKAGSCEERTGLPIVIKYKSKKACCDIMLGDSVNLYPSDELFEKMLSIGFSNIEVQYSIVTMM